VRIGEDFPRLTTCYVKRTIDDGEIPLLTTVVLTRICLGSLPRANWHCSSNSLKQRRPTLLGEFSDDQGQDNRAREREPDQLLSPPAYCRRLSGPARAIMKPKEAPQTFFTPPAS